jgi:hypothetical protein
VPEDLVEAHGALVKHLWDLKANQGKTAVPSGEGSLNLRDEDVPQFIKDILDPLRLPGVLL